jgi:hypothetical protein
MVLYAIWQEVFRAHAFWQGLGVMRQYFMPYGKKYAIMPAVVSSKCLSVQLLTPFTTRCRRNNPANIRMQEKGRLTRHYQHKASLVEEELRLDNAVIPDAPPTPPPATPPPPESPSLPPPPEANHAVRRLGIGDKQSADSTPQPALELSPSRAPSQCWQDWPPEDNHYPTPPAAPPKDQTPFSSSEWDLGSDYSEGGPGSHRKGC